MPVHRGEHSATWRLLLTVESEKSGCIPSPALLPDRAPDDARAEKCCLSDSRGKRETELPRCQRELFR